MPASRSSFKVVKVMESDHICTRTQAMTALLPHCPASLASEFVRIKKDHQNALRKTTARTVLGPSVMRVFAKGTRDVLMPTLTRIDVDALGNVQNQNAFSTWFDESVERIWRKLAPINRGNTRIAPGGKWGHSTKIMALFIRDLVLGSRYFLDNEVARLSPFLYVPIDGVVMQRLKKLGVRLSFTRIREIDSRDKFYHVQDLLGDVAVRESIPRVWFDDNWGDRQ